MIQDIYPSKLHNEYKNDVLKKDDDLVFIFKGKEILLINDKLPRVKDVEDDNLIFLFEIDNLNCFLSLKDYEGSYINIQELAFSNKLEERLNYCMYTAKHLNDWYKDNKYCGRCGKHLSHSTKERALVCKCGNTIYPKIMPAVIVGVKNKDEILLTKYATGFKHNALIAGFVEIGETIEETVIREVKEEVGLNVKNINYYKSQPWGIASDVLVGYYCDVDGDSTIKMDERELKSAIWTKREDIVLQPGELSLTNEMMKMFKEGKM